MDANHTSRLHTNTPSSTLARLPQRLTLGASNSHGSRFSWSAQRTAGCSKRNLLVFCVAWMTLLASSLWPAQAEAAENYLSAEPMENKKIRIDGMLREWPRGFSRLDQRLKGRGHKSRALIGYDDGSLYLAAKLVDERIARSSRAGSSEDHLRLELFVPSTNGAGGSLHRVDVYPGEPGKLPGLVKIDGRIIKTAKAVEAPTQNGLVLEAEVPWSALVKTKNLRVGLRGRLLYYNASRVGRIQSIIATSQSQGAAMPPLTLESETALFQTLLEPKRLPFQPARQAFGDLTGDGSVERVALYGHFLSIVGPGYKGGKQFYFNELDVSSADRILRLELRDLSGDGKDEIILEKRIGPEDTSREVLQVLSLGEDDAPVQVFAAEVGMDTESGSLRNRVKIQGEGSKATIKISQGTSQGIDPKTFREPKIGGGIISALLPWESVRSRVYAWKGDGLTQVEEVEWAPQMNRPSKATVRSAPPPPPRPPRASERLERVYALYKQDRGVGHEKPRFDLVTDVVEDSQMERVLVHGKDLVVFGKGFKKGRSYSYLTIGVEEAEDVLAVTTRDLVGDGKAEILVHAVLKAQASEELGGQIVERQALFIYKLIDHKITRIFAAETGRALEGKRILGGVAFLPKRPGVRIEVVPLRALGWNQDTYPFPEDVHPAGGLQPLLLPWGKVNSREYTFNGEAFVTR